MSVVISNGQGGKGLKMYLEIEKENIYVFISCPDVLHV